MKLFISGEVSRENVHKPEKKFSNLLKILKNSAFQYSYQEKYGF